MKKIAKTTFCLLAAFSMYVTGARAQWTLTGTGATGVLSTPGSISVAKETYTTGWFRNSVAGTGLVNSATATGIFSPSHGMMAIYNNGSFTAADVYANSWFRNNVAGTGLYNTVTGTGIVSPSAGLMAVYNGGNFSANEYYSTAWYRNNVAGTGLYNTATGTGIFSPSTGMMAVYNGGNFTANEVFANSWFRNNVAGTGMYNSVTGTGIVSPSAGMVAVYNNGNLTIGNAQYRAGYKLFVAEGILTERVKVAVNGSTAWADYVFDKNYELMPLEQVESFITEHKHLPGVPSTAEMQKEGNDLGKTDAKLLEKIEELTLYIIELKKETTLLRTLINKQ